MLMLKRFKACRKEGDKMSTEYVYKSTKKIEEILKCDYPWSGNATSSYWFGCNVVLWL